MGSLLDSILGMMNSGQLDGAPDAGQSAPSSAFPPFQLAPQQPDAPPPAPSAGGIPSAFQYLLGGQGAPGGGQGAPDAASLDDRFSPPGGGPAGSPTASYLAPGGVLAAVTGQGAPSTAPDFGPGGAPVPQPRPAEADQGGAPASPPGPAAGPGVTSANALDPYAPQSAPPASPEPPPRVRGPVSVPLGPSPVAPPGSTAPDAPAAPAQPAASTLDTLIARLQRSQRQNNSPVSQFLTSLGGGMANMKASPFAAGAFSSGFGGALEAGAKSSKEDIEQQTKLVDAAVRAKATGNTEAYRQAMVALRQNQQTQAAKAADVKAMAPVKIGTDSTGREIYGIRDPKTQQLRIVDPNSGKLLEPGQRPQGAGITDTGVASADDALPANSQLVSGEGQGTRNEDFLKTLAQTDPQRAALVKKLADYDVDPRALSVKGGHREALLGDVARYDPDYSMPNYPARAAAIKEFTAGGSTSPAAQITAGNTAIQHAGDMSDAAEEMKKVGEGGLLSKARNAGIPFVSYAAAQLQNKSVAGTPEGQALAKFLTARNHFSEEVTKFYAGSGGSEAERKRALDNLDAAKSVEELRAAINEEAKLMGGKVNALQDRWKNAVGGVGGWQAALKRANVPDYPVIQSQSAEALKKVKARSAGEDYQPPDADAPAGAPPSSSALKAAGSDPTAALAQARAAIAAGKDPAAVKQRLQQMGIDGSAL